ncbi:MAG: hypothetical protein GX905_03895 [Bacteroidales bacterium]|nr:hypothetical protein [Bacteroidales bacterium]
MKIFVAYYVENKTAPDNVDAVDLKESISINLPDDRKIKRIEIVPATRKKAVLEMFNQLIKKNEKQKNRV